MFQKSLVVCFTLLLAGCGGSTLTLYPAEGVVTLDGTPVAEAAVMFQPTTGPIAMGVTDAQGKFKLETANLPGAIPGPHQVTVTKTKTTGISADEQVSAEGIKTVYIVPAKYGNTKTSGLTVELTDTPQPIELKLLSK